MPILTILKPAGKEPTFKEHLLDVIAERRRWLERKIREVSRKRNPEFEINYWGDLLKELNHLDADVHLRLC